MLCCIIIKKFTTTGQNNIQIRNKNVKDPDHFPQKAQLRTIFLLIYLVSLKLSLYSCEMATRRHGFGKSQPWERPQQSSSIKNLSKLEVLDLWKGRVPGNIAEGSVSIVFITLWFRRQTLKLSPDWINSVSRWDPGPLKQSNAFVLWENPRKQACRAVLGWFMAKEPLI